MTGIFKNDWENEKDIKTKLPSFIYISGDETLTPARVDMGKNFGTKIINDLRIKRFLFQGATVRKAVALFF